MTLEDPRPDEQLADLASQGDAAAAESLAQRYLASLFDFAIRASLDQAVAQSVVEATLARSVAEQEKRPPQLSFRAWLFGLVRDEALEGVRQRARPDAAPDEETTALSSIDDRFIRLDGGSYDREVALWAWQAARSQRPRDYSLLDLVLRRHIDAADVADIAALSRSGIYAVLGRLRGAFEESFATSALYFRRGHCPELDEIVSQEPSLAPALRREIGRHADGCDLCRRTRAGLPSAADVLSALLNVDLPAGFAERLVIAAATAAPDLDTAAAVPAEEEEQPAPGLVAGAAAAVAGIATPALLEPDSPAIGDAGEAEATIEAEEEILTPAEPLDEPLIDEQSLETVTEDEIETAEEAALDEESAGEVPAEDEEEPEAPLHAAGVQAAGAPLFDDEVAPQEPGAAPPLEEPPEMYEEPGEQEAPVSGYEEQVEDAEEPEEAGVALVPASATAVATVPGASLPVDRGVGGGFPPRRPPVAQGGRWFDRRGPRRLLTIAAVLLVSAIAGYIGIAVGDSLQGGGSSVSGTGGPLPTRSPGIRQVACGTAPINMDQGSRADLTFDAAALPNYQIANVAVRPVSIGTSALAVDAKAQQGLSVLFEALPVGGPPGQIDEYDLAVTFARGEERTLAQCRIRVAAVGPTATATPAPTQTPTPRPLPTFTPVVVATPTATPEPPTPTPTLEPPTATPTPTATSTPTATGTPPTSTPTVTGTPPTSTPTPTATPTVTETPAV
jgi:DNA-directed RNA polymerase specialized sigma24 family protein